MPVCEFKSFILHAQVPIHRMAALQKQPTGSLSDKGNDTDLTLRPWQ